MAKALMERNGTGDVFMAPRLYDAMSGVFTGGKRDGLFDRAASALDIDDPQLLVDIGCGTGALTMALARRFPQSATRGIDPSSEMVGRARHVADRAGLDIDFSVGSAQTLDVDDETASAVSFSLSLHHIPAADRPLALAEAHRVVVPGGKILIVEFDPVGLLGRAFSLHGDDIAAELDIANALVDAGFVGVRSERLTRRMLRWWTATRS